MTKALHVLLLTASAFAADAQNLARFSDIAPGMTDKRLEKEAVWLANKQGMNFNWHERYRKAVIVSHKWELDLDKNGFIRGRKIHMELYAELPSGRCAMADFCFKQKVLPNETFTSELYYDSVGEIVFVACE